MLAIPAKEGIADFVAVDRVGHMCFVVAIAAGAAKAAVGDVAAANAVSAAARLHSRPANR